MKNGAKFVVTILGHFQASFPAKRERGTATFHQKCHGIFQGDFHEWIQEKSSPQQVCKRCRDEERGFLGGGGIDEVEDAEGLPCP